VKIEEEIKRIEEEIRNTPYNKATQHHIGRLKAKLAKLREQVERTEKKGKREEGIKKSGDATAVLVGYPSVGKSSLLTALTEKYSDIAEYPFTTKDTVPGMLRYKDARIQIFDLPGLIEGASNGRGDGRYILSKVRVADLVIIVTDIYRVGAVDKIKEELEKVGIRLDKKPPQINIKKSSEGGIEIYNTVQLTKINKKTVVTVLREYGVYNAKLFINQDIGVEDLIDAVARNRVYLPSITVVNKIDRVKTLNKIDGVIYTSAKTGEGIEKLKEEIYNKMNFKRIFLKARDSKKLEPFIVRGNSTVLDVAKRIHRDFVKKFRYAKVWGRSVRYSGQRVGLYHVLEDGDIVEIKIK